MDEIQAMRSESRHHLIKPATPVEELIPYLELADMFLVMSVEPGFGGQAFIPESLERDQKSFAALLDERGLKTDIEVDGGIYRENVAKRYWMRERMLLFPAPGVYQRRYQRKYNRDLWRY